MQHDSRRGVLLLPRNESRDYLKWIQGQREGEQMIEMGKENAGMDRARKKRKKGRENWGIQSLGRVFAWWCDMMRVWHGGAILSVLVLLVRAWTQGTERVLLGHRSQMTLFSFPVCRKNHKLKIRMAVHNALDLVFDRTNHNHNSRKKIKGKRAWWPW
jgi:hypothetical protein